VEIGFSNPNEEHYCRLLVALWRADRPWVTQDDVPADWGALRALKRKLWIEQKKAPSGVKAQFQLTESGRGMAKVVASLLEV
jgi:hypothetical protein